MAAHTPGPAIYQKIAADLRAQIADGTLRPGQQVGTVAELAHRFEIGEATIRRAMTRLRFEGLIVGARGEVPRVARPPVKRTVKMPRGAETEFRLPTPEEIAELGIAGGVWVAVVSYGGREDVYPVDRVHLTFR